MSVQILDCPERKHRFEFEYDGALPDSITCPQCNRTFNSSDYTALLVCPGCHTKLAVPVDMLAQQEFSCPKCDALIKTFQSNLFDMDSVDSTLDCAPGKSHTSKQLLQEGAIIDKYQIKHLIGKGGMAEVYLAEHLLLKRDYAVKIMKQNLYTENEIGIKRFIREAKLAHDIDHPNITKVFDVGSDPQTGFLFIAMEYIDGQSLLKICTQKKFSEAELIQVGIEMSNALIELEKHHVVHRDIKPSNIMFTKDGTLKLMDLGIAKSESKDHGEITLTMDQSAIGTPSYASPEQCKSAHKVDSRADIYCLGSTLYHLASGKLPFDGETSMEIILKVMLHEPEPLAKLRPDLSRHLVELIEKMMKKNPEQRPQNAEQLLELFQQQKSSFSDVLSRMLPRWIRKKIFWKYAAVILLLAVAAAQFIFYTMEQKKQDEEKHEFISRHTNPVRHYFHKITAAPGSIKSSMESTQKKQIVQVVQKTKSNQNIRIAPSQKTNLQKNKIAVVFQKQTNMIAAKKNPIQKRSIAKPVLPANKVRTLQYRLNLAEWKLNELLQRKDDCFLKNEQIAFYRQQISDFKRADATKKRAQAIPLPALSAENEQFLKDLIFTKGDPHQLYRRLMQLILRGEICLDNKIADPQGKEYTLLAYFCAGKGLHMGYIRFIFQRCIFNPDCDLRADQMRKMRGRNVYLILITLEKIVQAGRDEIDRLDKSCSFLEYLTNYLPVNWFVIKTFLKMGVDPNTVFSNGRTLLHYAASYYKTEEIVQMMYFSGFNQWNRKDKEGITAYQLAFRHANQECIDFLNKIPGIDKKTEQTDKLQNELYWGVVQNNTDDIQHALKSGAKPDFLYGNRQNLLDIAVQYDKLHSFKEMERCIPVQNYGRVTNLLNKCIAGNSLDTMEYILAKYTKKVNINHLLNYMQPQPYAHRSLPYHVLQRYGKESPDTAIGILKLFNKYGWQFDNPLAKKHHDEILKMESNLHPDVVTYLKKQPSAGMKNPQLQNRNPLKKSLNHGIVLYIRDRFHFSSYEAAESGFTGITESYLFLKPVINNKMIIAPKYGINYAVKMTGYIHIDAAGTYVFSTLHDDEAAVNINGVKNYWNRPNNKIANCQTTVRFEQAGYYPVTFYLSNSGGKNVYFSLYWKRPDSAAFIAVPDSVWFKNITEQSPKVNLNPSANPAKIAKTELPPQSELFFPLIHNSEGDVILSAYGKVRIGSQNALVLKQPVKPPYTIRTVCKVTGMDLRFKLCNGTIIFNWERNPKDLRLDLPKLKSPRNNVADGSLPMNQWVEIKIEVGKKRLKIYVNGRRRCTSNGNFGESTVAMYTCLSCQAVVKSFVIEKN